MKKKNPEIYIPIKDIKLIDSKKMSANAEKDFNDYMIKLREIWWDLFLCLYQSIATHKKKPINEIKRLCEAFIENTDLKKEYEKPWFNLFFCIFKIIDLHGLNPIEEIIDMCKAYEEEKDEKESIQ